MLTLLLGGRGCLGEGRLGLPGQVWKLSPLFLPFPTSATRLFYMYAFVFAVQSTWKNCLGHLHVSILLLFCSVDLLLLVRLVAPSTVQPVPICNRECDREALSRIHTGRCSEFSTAFW